MQETFICRNHIRHFGVLKGRSPETLMLCGTFSLHQACTYVEVGTRAPWSVTASGTCTLPSPLPSPFFPISLHHQASELVGVQSVTPLSARSSIQQEVGSIPTDPRVPYVELPRGGRPLLLWQWTINNIGVACTGNTGSD